MGRIKRIIALVIVFSVIITSSGFVTACSSQDTQKVKMGDWLVMVNDSFGMFSYLSDEPYFENVTVENPYFEAVQIAAEWNVVNTSEKLNLDKNITWKEVLVTLVNAGAFLQEDATEDEKVEYGIKHFKDTIDEKTLKKEIQIEEANSLLEIAKEKWANLTFEEGMELVEYAEGVKDYSQGEDALRNYRIDEEGCIWVKSEDASQISEGDIFVLPGNEYMTGISAYKAVDIEEDGEYTKIEVDSDLPLEEVIDEMYIAETLVATNENVVITDPYGNVIYAGAEIVASHFSDEASGNVNLTYVEGQNEMLKTAKSHSLSSTFEVGDCKVTLKGTISDTFSMEASVETGNLLNVPKNSQKKLTGKISTSISNLSVTPVCEFSLGKIKEASLRVNYKQKNSFAFAFKDAKEGVFAPYNNGNGKYLTNVLKAKLKDKNVKGNGAKTIKICSITLLGSGSPLRLCMDVSLKVAVDGSVSVVITENTTKGAEYKNGKLRFINENDIDREVNIKGKIEGTISVGPALYVAGLKKCVVGVAATAGVGASASLQLKLVDDQNHLLESSDASDIRPETVENLDIQITATADAIEQAVSLMGYTYKPISETIDLHVDTCADISVYGILRLEISESFLKNIIGGKVKVSVEFYGEKNAKFMHFHSDNWGTFRAAYGSEAGKDLCTLKYTPFEDTTETETLIETELLSETESIIEEATENAIEFEGISGEYLTLKEMNAILQVGDVYSVVVEQIPEGYSKDDLVISSSDTGIVIVNANGTVTAMNSGSVVLTVSTSDGEYSAFLAITVLEPQDTVTI